MAPAAHELRRRGLRDRRGGGRVDILDHLARAAAARGGARLLHPGGRSRRPAAAALHHAGGALAAAGEPRGRRSALPGDAARLRGQALRRPCAASTCSRSGARSRSSCATARSCPARSTLTMQVARLLEPRTERSFVAKLRQMVRAIELERALSKDEILSLYLSLAPYGGNLEGVRAAVARLFRQGAAPADAWARRRCWWRCRSRRSSAVPTVRSRPRATPATACSIASPAPASFRATRSPAPSRSRCRTDALPMPMLAPHAADAAVAAAPERRLHRLTIDAPLQTTLEDLGARARARARPRHLDRHPRGRPRQRRGARARRLRRTISTRAAPARST